MTTPPSPLGQQPEICFGADLQRPFKIRVRDDGSTKVTVDWDLILDPRAGSDVYVGLFKFLADPESALRDLWADAFLAGARSAQA